MTSQRASWRLKSSKTHSTVCLDQHKTHYWPFVREKHEKGRQLKGSFVGCILTLTEIIVISMKFPWLDAKKLSFCIIKCSRWRKCPLVRHLMASYTATDISQCWRNFRQWQAEFIVFDNFLCSLWRKIRQTDISVSVHSLWHTQGHWPGFIAWQRHFF